jgi:hypothetical protein
MCSECFHTRDGGIFEILTTAIGTLFDRRRPEGGSVSKFALVFKIGQIRGRNFETRSAFFEIFLSASVTAASP